VGDNAADLAVWRYARHAYVAGGDRRLLARASALAQSASAPHATAHPPAVLAFLRALRLHQWLKNLLLLVPLLSAHRYGDPQALWASLVALGCFGLAASAIYLINDLADLEDDRRHGRKRRRPFAAGTLPLAVGWFAAPILIAMTTVAAWRWLPHGFFLVLLIYLALTSAYSFRLKRLMALDVITLATLYTLRLVAGAEAIGVPISFWALTFSLFVFTSLALIKRFTELKSARAAGHRDPLPGRGYRPDDLEMVSALGAAAGYLSVLVLALYVQDAATATLYPAPRVLWLACPLLLYWISRVWLIAHRGGMHDDPVVFALRDRASLIVGALFMGVFALARLGV
jgi:4-hydroxybenzoate polyprenyltransferase